LGSARRLPPPDARRDRGFVVRIDCRLDPGSAVRIDGELHRRSPRRPAALRDGRQAGQAVVVLGRRRPPRAAAVRHGSAGVDARVARHLGRRPHGGGERRQRRAAEQTLPAAVAEAPAERRPAGRRLDGRARQCLVCLAPRAQLSDADGPAQGCSRGGLCQHGLALTPLGRRHHGRRGRARRAGRVVEARRLHARRGRPAEEKPGVDASARRRYAEGVLDGRRGEPPGEHWLLGRHGVERRHNRLGREGPLRRGRRRLDILLFLRRQHSRLLKDLVRPSPVEGAHRPVHLRGRRLKNIGSRGGGEIDVHPRHVRVGVPESRVESGCRGRRRHGIAEHFARSRHKGAHVGRLLLLLLLRRPQEIRLAVALIILHFGGVGLQLRRKLARTLGSRWWRRRRLSLLLLLLLCLLRFLDRAASSRFLG